MSSPSEGPPAASPVGIDQPRAEAGGAETRASLHVAAPLSGTVVELTEVPDPVFSGAMVGPGVAVDPERTVSEAVSPIDGTIVKLHPHAFVVVGEGGRGVLVHLGIGTVRLKGEGFTLLLREGDTIGAGTPVVRWDPGGVEAGGRSPMCPVIALDATTSDIHAVATPGPVRAGDPLFSWT